jgi:hypothetical protein
MEQHLIIPMVLYVIYILALGVLNFLARYRALRHGVVRLELFKAYTQSAPEKLIVIGRHFDNQFQAPLLFLAAGAAHLAMKDVGGLTVILSWVFVATRLLHSLEHLGRNRIGLRAIWYALGLLVTVALWIQLLINTMKAL